MYRPRNGQRLGLALDRTRTGNHRHIACSKAGPGHLHDSALRLHLAAHQLERLGDPDDFFDPLQIGDTGRIHWSGIAGDADRGPLRSRHDVGLETHLLDPAADGLDLRGAGAAFHHH
jgi:hypothetical protein